MVFLTSSLLFPISLLLTTASAGLYTKSSPVLQVDAKTYPSLIAASNHTTILEFYAPWCGHCRNLQPAYEKAAKSLKGLAKVAAVDCDEEANKPFCGSMGVQGFPTLKIVKPGKKAGRPIVEDYQGARSAKAIVEAVKEKIPNHVKRVGDKDLEDWLKTNNASSKAVLFTDKGTTSALLKAVAVDFLGGVDIAQVRSKEKTAVQTFGITSFPTLVLLPGGEQEAIVYDGEMTKEGIVAFLSQVSAPNPDPAPKKAKSQSKSKAKPSAKPSKKASAKSDGRDPNVGAGARDERAAIKRAKEEQALRKASAEHKSAEASEAATSVMEEVVEESGMPTESPNPKVETPEHAEL